MVVKSKLLDRVSWDILSYVGKFTDNVPMASTVALGTASTEVGYVSPWLYSA